MDGLVLIARLIDAFGVRGQVTVRSFTSPDDNCFGYGPLLDADRQIRLTPLRHSRRRPGYFVVTPEESLSREDWRVIRGLDLYTGIDQFAPPEDGELHAASLIGCAIEHMDGRELGRVRAVQNFGAGDILDIVCGEIDYMLPFNDEIATDIRIGEQRILSTCQDEWLPASLRKPG